MDNEYLVLEDSVRNSFGSVVWSHKIQEKQADIYSLKYKYMETINIIAASLTSVGIVSLLFTDELWLKILSSLLSFISIFVSAFFKSFNLQELVSLHNKTAQKLLCVRDELKFLLMLICLKQKEINELTDMYKSIVIKLDKIYAEAPRTTDKAVDKARIALNVTKDNNFTDVEIDRNLPNTLKRRKGNE